MASRSVEIISGTVLAITREAAAPVVRAEAEACADRANEMARANGWGLDVDPYVASESRGLGHVRARRFRHNEAVAENAKHNTLLKSMGV